MKYHLIITYYRKDKKNIRLIIIIIQANLVTIIIRQIIQFKYIQMQTIILAKHF